MKRPLGDTVLEMVESVQPFGPRQEQIRVVKVYFDVPLEVAVRGSIKNAELLGDLPTWRWRTWFDQKPGRMKLECNLGERA
jgi:hypothetical protein